MSDEDSRVITEIGLLNTTIEAERAAYGRPIEARHRGLPYPGTFAIDAAGVVTSKWFEPSHRVRPSAATLLGDLDQDLHLERGAGAETSTQGVQVAAWFESGAVHANQLHQLRVRLQTDPGVHLYVDPVPDGYRGLSVAVDGDDRLSVRPFPRPTGTPLHIEGLPEEFSVVEGQVDLGVPFLLASDRDTAGDPVREVTLGVEVAFQACTDETCFMPERVRLELPLREEPNPAYESVEPDLLGPLILRRLIESPRPEPELREIVFAGLAGTEGDEAATAFTEMLADLVDQGLIEQAPDGRWQAVG